MSETNHLESLNRKLTVIKDRVRGCVHRKATGVYLYGRPGTSKTYTVRHTLDTLAVKYAYSNGHLTPIGLFDLIAENSNRIIVIDDINSIFNAPISLQLLLAALGNGHDGSGVRHVRHKTAKGDRVVAFDGAIIGVSNLALDGHHSDALRALKDRIHVCHYEPTDLEVVALCRQIASQGLWGVKPDKCQTVLNYLLKELESHELRPSVRLYIDKAMRDYDLWASGHSEAHWQDLVRNSVEQQLVELTRPTTDLGRQERLDAERRIALEIHQTHDSKADRIGAWASATGGSQAGFYRRVAELKKLGRLGDN